MRALGHAIKKLVPQALKDPFFTGLVQDWKIIVGSPLDAYTYPERLGNDSSGKALWIVVEHAFALEAQYHIPKIHEKVNLYAGGDTRIEKIYIKARTCIHRTELPSILKPIAETYTMQALEDTCIPETVARTLTTISEGSFKSALVCYLKKAHCSKPTR